MTLTDGNDLHVAAGSEELGCQLEDFIQTALSNRLPAPLNDDVPPLESYAAEATDSPHPSGDEVPPEISLEDALKRFALISGTTKIWDRFQKQRLTSAAFSMAIGAAVAKEWKASGAKRQILERDVRSLLAEAQASAQGRGGVAEALERFVYLSVSSTAWDHQRRQVTRLDDIKHEIPEVYDFWYRHPKRKCVDKDNLVFDPTQSADPKTHINMFRGLPLKPDFDDSKCEHIRKMFWRLCNCDETVWRWLAKWLAYPLQNVGAKMATAVLMHSEVHGSGKSLLFDGVMRPIYGDYGATLGQHQMESQYTDWQSNLLYGLFEEIFSREKKYSQTGTVKQMITSTTTRIEKKFVSGWEEANHINCIFLSNELQPFPVEPSDRRFLVTWPNWKLGDELEKAVAAELENGGVESFFGWLLNLPLGDFGRHTKPPMTDAKQRLIDFGRPSWDVFYQEWADGLLDAPFHTCLVADLHAVYLRWCNRGKYSPMHLGMFSSSLAGRLQRRRDLKYDEPGRAGLKRRSNRKGAFFIFPDHQPEDKQQSEWLTGCVVNFRHESGLEDAE